MFFQNPLLVFWCSCTRCSGFETTNALLLVSPRDFDAFVALPPDSCTAFFIPLLFKIMGVLSYFYCFFKPHQYFLFFLTDGSSIILFKPHRRVCFAVSVYSYVVRIRKKLCVLVSDTVLFFVLELSFLC